jgi:arylformamidase
MNIYDISVRIPDAPVYPGDPETRLHRALNIADKDQCNLTEITMSAHAGTHADSPLHFIGGGMAIDALDPAVFCGTARVVTVYKAQGDIEKEDLAPLSIQKGERILFKTRNALDGHIVDREFYKDFCGFSAEAAAYLAQIGPVLVGIDYASIGGPEAHRAVLGAGIAALEWLDLRRVADGRYFLSAAPLKIGGAEGAPARALLFDSINL